MDEQARARDPERKGINFIISSSMDVITQPATPTFDPATGLQTAAPPPEPVDLNSVQIRLSTTLRNVRLVDAIDAIVKTADRPIKVSIEDYAVVFTQRTPEPERDVSSPGGGCHAGGGAGGTSPSGPAAWSCDFCPHFGQRNVTPARAESGRRIVA